MLISKTIDRWSIHGSGLLGQKPILENSALVAAHSRGASVRINDRHLMIGARTSYSLFHHELGVISRKRIAESMLEAIVRIV